MNGVVVRTLILVLALSIFACGVGDTFAPCERALIDQADTTVPMRLWVIDNPQDTMLLRAQAGAFSLSDFGTERYRRLKAGMLTTVTDPDNPGVGIAAPQVGVSKRLIAVQRFDKAGDPIEFYANPEIDLFSDDKCWGREGCLSVPEGASDTVLRSVEIELSYLSEETHQRERERISGFTAVIFQHEIDHLHGVLYIDY